jgi:hypothetical protein
MPFIRKPFSVFFAELAVAVEAGREDDPVAESMQLQVIEVGPGDWRLSQEVVCWTDDPVSSMPVLDSSFVLSS